jgi:methionyl-tRNA synthetase
MPDTAAKMQKHLGLDPAAPFYLLDRIRSWKSINPGLQLPKSVVLFPRVEPAEKKAASADKPDKAAVNSAIKKEITLEEFSKIDLRVATVVKAEKIPRAKKVLKLEVDLGQKRTIVAGIAEKYTPEELIGKQVIIVANLKPAKLMGIVSNGMLIAAVDNSGPTVAVLDQPVDPGTPLR